MGDGRFDTADTCFYEASVWFIHSRGRMNLVCNFRITERLVPMRDVPNAFILLQSDARIEMVEQGIFLPGLAIAIVG